MYAVHGIDSIGCRCTRKVRGIYPRYPSTVTARHVPAICMHSRHQPVIAQLVEHLTVEVCSDQMVPGSIPGDRICLRHRSRDFHAGLGCVEKWREGSGCQSPPWPGLQPHAYAVRREDSAALDGKHLSHRRHRSPTQPRRFLPAHQWSSGRIHRCHRCDPGSIPG